MTDHTYDNEHGGRTRGKRGIAGALKRALVPVVAVAALAVSPVASAAPQTGPTVPGHPNQLADATGHLPLTVRGPKGAIEHIKGGWVLNSAGKNWRFTSAQSTAPAVNIKGAFTVSAWVWTGAGYRGSEFAVSQGTGQASSFELGRSYDWAHPGGPALWSFTVNGQVGGQYTAYSKPNAYRTANTWALLTGVWNPSKHRAYLYVNGVEAGSHYAPNVTTNPGGLVLGMEREGDAWANGWDGFIGHVQVWNQALTSAQVLQIAKYGGPAHLKATHSWLVA